MKLKCVNHKRRVHVLNEGKVVHREDGTRCQMLAVDFAGTSATGQAWYDSIVEIGGHMMDPRTVWLLQHNRNRRWRTNHNGKGNRREQFQGRKH